LKGKSTHEKIQDLRKTLASKKAWGFILNALDEIAWLFNLRGSDIPFNPVFFSYALVTEDEAILYINSSKLTQEVINTFLCHENHSKCIQNEKAKDALTNLVVFKPYDSVFEDLPKVGAKYKDSGKVFLE
jgi:Xaa-Pro aminopeptidase